MSWRRIIPIIDLMCMLIELSDPTTSFIRIDADPGKKHTLPAVTQSIDSESRRSVNKSTDTYGRDDAGTGSNSAANTSQSPVSVAQVTLCHSAIVTKYFQLKIDWVSPQWTPTTTSLNDQAYPETFKRPPIA